MVKSMLDMQTDCRNRVKALNGGLRQPESIIHLFLTCHGLTDLRQELDNGVGVVDPQEWFLKKLKELNNNYKSKPDPDRFRDMEQYQEFRKQVWEATHEGGAPPEEGNVDDEDEDIVISTQKVSLICPITKKLLEDPVMAPGCEHVYSKAAIMQMEVLPNGQTEVSSPGQRGFPKLGSFLTAFDPAFALHLHSVLSQAVHVASRRRIWCSPRSDC